MEVIGIVGAALLVLVLFFVFAVAMVAVMTASKANTQGGGESLVQQVVALQIENMRIRDHLDGVEERTREQLTRAYFAGMNRTNEVLLKHEVCTKEQIAAAFDKQNAADEAEKTLLEMKGPSSAKN